MMTADSKGITMIPTALRDATRKAAEGARKTTSTHGDPMAPKKKRRHDKRMAIVTGVFNQEPLVHCETTLLKGSNDITDVYPSCRAPACCDKCRDDLWFKKIDAHDISNSKGMDISEKKDGP